MLSAGLGILVTVLALQSSGYSKSIGGDGAVYPRISVALLLPSMPTLTLVNCPTVVLSSGTYVSNSFLFALAYSATQHSLQIRAGYFLFLASFCSIDFFAHLLQTSALC